MPKDPEVNLAEYTFEGPSQEALTDLQSLSEEDKKELLMAGVDVTGKDRSGSFLHMNHSPLYCKTDKPGVEILDYKKAKEKYDDFDQYDWKLVDPDQDEFTRKVYENTHGGYVVRTQPGAKIKEPVQSCLFIKGQKVGQNVHNIVIVEEDSELHIITGCSVSSETKEGVHLGISEFYVKKGGKLTFTMIHNWGENVTVRPRTKGIVEEGGQFLSNYVLLKPVKNLQSYPTINLAGKGAVGRFNSIIVAPKGSYINSGSRLLLNAPDTRGEIIARTITTGGTIINPGHIAGHAVPAKGHLECKGLILGDGVIHAVPELEGTIEGCELSHEAAVGKIAQEEIEYLMARGLDEDEATSTIVRGFLSVDIMGLPKELNDLIEKTIAETEADMF